jgi:TP901 family phage tail tape measure protein
MNTSQATAAMTNLKAAWAGVTAVTEKAMTGLMLAAGGIIAVGAAFYAATAMISGYEVALVRAGAIGGLTASQTGLLGNKIQQSAIKYGVAINDISDGIIELTKAGMNYEQTMGMVDTITKVAMANNIDYASAADIAVIATKAFKIPLTDLSGHMDKLQYVVQKTLMDMSDFNDILQYTGSTAVTFKVVPEELYAMAGALADVAQQAGQGSRHVNRLMVEMLKEVDQVQAWTDSLGMSVQVIKDGRLNITELIAAFSKLGMSQDVMLQSLNQFSILSSQAWLALLNNSKEYFDLLQGQAGATGTLETVVAPQLQTLQVQLKSLKAAFQAAFLTHDFITETHKAFDVLNKSVLNLIPNIQQLVFGLLQQAPAMFTSLFHIIQSVLPLLSNVLLPVMKTFSDILFTLTGGNNGTLVRLVLIFYMLRKYANPLGAAMDLYNFHFKELSLTTAVLQRNMLGIVSALILVIALRDKVKWAMYAVAASILAVAIAVVALRSVFGDWMAALKFGVTLASAIASSIAMIAMLQASTPSKLSNAAIDSSNASIAPLKMHSGSRYVAETGTYILKKGEAVLPDTTSTFGNNQFTLINRGTIYGSEDALRKLVRKIMREETGRVYA